MRQRGAQASAALGTLAGEAVWIATTHPAERVARAERKGCICDLVVCARTLTLHDLFLLSSPVPSSADGSFLLYIQP